MNQFINHPTDEPLGAANRILRYLKMTPAKGLYLLMEGRENINRCCLGESVADKSQHLGTTHMYEKFSNIAK